LEYHQTGISREETGREMENILEKREKMKVEIKEEIKELRKREKSND
jgi:hypothetical protein